MDEIGWSAAQVADALIRMSTTVGWWLIVLVGVFGVLYKHGWPWRPKQ